MRLINIVPDISDYSFEIGSVGVDSRSIQKGDLFIALPLINGESEKKHIKQALDQGASAVLCSNTLDLSEFTYAYPHVLFHRVEHPRIERTKIAARLYPGLPPYIAAVTGTNGKSSVASFTAQISRLLGYRSCFMGTVGVDAPVDVQEKLPVVSLTSADPFVLHQALSILENNNVPYVALEASSHGLDQNRMDGLTIKAAGFTNLERDHLDYHKTMEHYFKAKARLFTDLLAREGTAVLNHDSAQYDALRRLCLHQRVISYGVHPLADFSIEALLPEQDGQILKLRILGRPYEIQLPLIGHFQALNALCALGLAVGCGHAVEDVLTVLSQLKTVSGRMQRVGVTAKKASVYVDYAQNVDGMRIALHAIRPYVKGQLTVVFGCGGGRDLSRRQGMGKVAYEGADRVIITDDNPRYEDPRQIREALLSGCPHGIEIANRLDAIRYALETMEPGDVCLIAGKGHETVEIVGDKKIPYNDFDAARKILLDIGGTW